MDNLFLNNNGTTVNDHVYVIKIKLHDAKSCKKEDAARWMPWFKIKKSILIGDTDHNGYGLYALREFKKGDMLGIYMGQYVGNMLNQNNGEW